LQQPDSARHYAGAALAALTVGAGNASPLTAEGPDAGGFAYPWSLHPHGPPNCRVPARRV